MAVDLLGLPASRGRSSSGKSTPVPIRSLLGYAAYEAVRVTLDAEFGRLRADYPLLRDAPGANKYIIAALNGQAGGGDPGQMEVLKSRSGRRPRI